MTAGRGLGVAWVARGWTTWEGPRGRRLGNRACSAARGGGIRPLGHRQTTDLHCHKLIVNGDLFCQEVGADCGLVPAQAMCARRCMRRLRLGWREMQDATAGAHALAGEFVVYELLHQRRLPDAGIAEDDHLKQHFPRHQCRAAHRRQNPPRDAAIVFERGRGGGWAMVADAYIYLQATTDTRYGRLGGLGLVSPCVRSGLKRSINIAN
eukprot:scaffold17730_cov103-Isochrysis_galbana.AAC.1